jgi:hypothetical protein
VVSQPDEFTPDTFYGLAPSRPSPPIASDIEHLIWALQNLHHIGDASDGSGEGASLWGSAGQTDPSAYEVSSPPPLVDAEDGSSPYEPWRARADWPPSIFTGSPADAPEPRFYTARPGDSISTILGTSDPAAIGAFMQLNGLNSSQIRAGRTYQLSDPNAPRLDGATRLGLAALKVDNERRAALAAMRHSAVGQGLQDWEAAAPGADFSSYTTFGLRHGSRAHPSSALLGQRLAEFASPQAQLARVLANLQQPRDQGIINGQVYEGFHTATADGIRPPPPSLRNYDPTDDQRVQTLATMEANPFASWEGAARLARPHDPGINARFGLLDALGDVLLSHGAAADAAENPIWRTTRTPEFETAPAAGLAGRSPETSPQEAGFGTHGQFVDAATNQYQKLQDHHYDQIAQRVAQGEIPDDPMIIGQRLDGEVRPEMRRWLGRQDIREGPGEIVRLNRRLYDQRPHHDEQEPRPFRIPDLYVPGAGIILDGSMAAKTEEFPQIRDFRDFSQGANTVIIRPAGLDAADLGMAKLVGSHGIVQRKK